MSRKQSYSYYPPFLIPLLTLILIVLTVATVIVAITGPKQGTAVIDGTTTASPDSDPSGSGSESEKPSTPAQSGSSGVTDTPRPGVTYTDITLLSAGDIMFHGDNVVAGDHDGDGVYDFSPFFQYLPEIVGRYDYAVANLETTFSGGSVGYTRPSQTSFNTPDAALSAIRACGFDMMLFANNHTNDRRLAGLTRTVTKVRESGMELIGASDEKNGQMWQVVDVKGTKLGMLNYTNDGTWGEAATNTLNGVALGDSEGYVNVFYLAKLAEFYRKVEQDIAAVKAAGADLVVCYIHWGPEYDVQPRQNTKQIAQKLCDLGVDAIIGSHPHVVQPMEVLTSSTDPDRKTICFYSLGNFLSNQNRKTLDRTDCYGNDPENTENGLMVVLTIRKYSTGQTLLVSAETIPTWVHRYENRDGKNYRIIPLRDALKAPASFGLDDSAFGREHAAASLAYTEDLLSDAVEAFVSSIRLPSGTEGAVPASASRKD